MELDRKARRQSIEVNFILSMVVSLLNFALSLVNYERVLKMLSKNVDNEVCPQ